MPGAGGLGAAREGSGPEQEQALPGGHSNYGAGLCPESTENPKIID